MSQAVAEQVIKPNLQAIRSRIAAGEYASHIANELGVSPQILSYHLRQDADWQLVLQAAHETRLDSEQAELDAAIVRRDFELARAREGKLKRLEWRAERECPDRWGIRQKIEHSGQVPTMQILVVNAPQTGDAAALPAISANDLTKVNE